MSALHLWPDQETSEQGQRLGYRTRSSTRLNNPTLCVQIRGRHYESLNWSLGGILLGGYNGVLSEGEQFDIDSIGLAGKRLWPVLINARVVRIGGEIADKFLGDLLFIYIRSNGEAAQQISDLRLNTRVEGVDHRAGQGGVR